MQLLLNFKLNVTRETYEETKAALEFVDQNTYRSHLLVAQLHPTSPVPIYPVKTSPKHAHQHQQRANKTANAIKAAIEEAQAHDPEDAMPKGPSPRRDDVTSVSSLPVTAVLTDRPVLLARQNNSTEYKIERVHETARHGLINEGTLAAMGPLRNVQQSTDIEISSPVKRSTISRNVHRMEFTPPSLAAPAANAREFSAEFNDILKAQWVYTSPTKHQGTTQHHMARAHTPVKEFSHGIRQPVASAWSPISAVHSARTDVHSAYIPPRPESARAQYLSSFVDRSDRERATWRKEPSPAARPESRGTHHPLSEFARVAPNASTTPRRSMDFSRVPSNTAMSFFPESRGVHYPQAEFARVASNNSTTPRRNMEFSQVPSTSATTSFHSSNVVSTRQQHPGVVQIATPPQNSTPRHDYAAGQTAVQVRYTAHPHTEFYNAPAAEFAVQPAPARRDYSMVPDAASRPVPAGEAAWRPIESHRTGYRGEMHAAQMYVEAYRASYRASSPYGTASSPSVSIPHKHKFVSLDRAGTPSVSTPIRFDRAHLERAGPSSMSAAHHGYRPLSARF